MPALNLEQFNYELDTAVKQLTDRDVVAFQRLLALKLFEKIIRKTPVDTGRARGNWRISVNGFDDSIVPIEGHTGEVYEDLGPVGLTTLGMAQAALTPQSVPLGSIIYISNSLPYILRLEQGWSKQAAAGMVATSVAEVEMERTGSEGGAP